MVRSNRIMNKYNRKSRHKRATSTLVNLDGVHNFNVFRPMAQLEEELSLIN